MKDIKTSAPRAPQSQLTGKTGAKPVMAPVSTVAQYVAGDIKGGESAHNYRMSVIEGALREALKGNSRPLMEAATFATGKSKKARAYAAGFGALNIPTEIPARVKYVGKLDAPENEAARAEILQRVAAMAFDFEAAFLTVISAPTEKKASAPASAPATDATDATEASAADAPVAPVAVAELLVSEVLESAVKAIAGGLAMDDEIAALEQAIAQYRASRATLAALEKATATEEATV